MTIPAPAATRGGYGEFIEGLSHNGQELRAAVFNEREVRVAAGLSMTLGAVALAFAFFTSVYLPLQLVTAFLFLEFLTRVTAGLNYSPMGRLARWVTHHEPPQWVSAKPKRFAWSLALLMSLILIVILTSEGRGALPLTMSLIFVSLMWLEAILGFCLGCEIHGLLVRRGWATKDEAFEVCARGACTPETRR